MRKMKRILALGAAALMLTSAFAMPASAEEIWVVIQRGS